MRIITYCVVGVSVCLYFFPGDDFGVLCKLIDGEFNRSGPYCCRLAEKYIDMQIEVTCITSTWAHLGYNMRFRVIVQVTGRLISLK